MTSQTPVSPEDRDFLLQTDVTGGIRDRLAKRDWLTLYSWSESKRERVTYWCGLLDPTAVAEALETDDWDLHIDEGMPGFMQTYPAGEPANTYHPFGGDDGARPLVVHRSFAGAAPAYFEMCEEFRHYHNLAPSRGQATLLDFDESGREIEVVRISPQSVQAKKGYVRQFQGGTQLFLALYLEIARFSTIALDDIPETDRQSRHDTEFSRCRLSVFDCDFKDGYSSFSLLRAKVLLPPPDKSQSGLWPFLRQDDRDVSFIVGTDAEGNPVEHTSSPEALEEIAKSGTGSVGYLSPVFFRRAVLEKYYAEPARYTIEDGLLRCLELWHCQIDNDIKDYVSIFLGDLGRDLPYGERLHWRQFNVAPEARLSRTNVLRSFMAEAADATAPDLVFRQTYQTIREGWQRAQGWPLFLPLDPGDQHLLSTIHVPTVDEQSAMDAQVLALAQLLVDYLNGKELAKRASAPPAKPKAIYRLEAFLLSTTFPSTHRTIRFFRDLQELRSTGSAHRKSSSYGKALAKLGIGIDDRRAAVERLLMEAIEMLTALGAHFAPA